jgi:SAM-dependent methyltransferase
MTTSDASTTESGSWDQRGDSFGLAAATYDRSRPSYPAEAVEWVLGSEPLEVLDLGAGTGLLTRALVAAGHRVTAVEPDEAMLAQLLEVTPGVEGIAAGAESIPLPDSSVDALVVGHAYHWFDVDPAHTEIARLIRGEGTFGTFWNLRDEEVPWSAELTRILSDEDSSTDAVGPPTIMLHGAVDVLRGRKDGPAWLKSPTFGDRFSEIERNFFDNEVEHTPETLLALIRSRSYYLTSSEERQKEIDAAIEGLTSSHPELQGRETFPLPYVTVAFRSRALPRS